MVVSNTSPIMNLAVVGHLELLRDLYGQVLIPEAVARELSAIEGRRPLDLGIEASPWIRVCAVADSRLVTSLLRQLHDGEAEAIALAVERQPRLLLIDERRGGKVAEDLGLRCMGVLGVLLAAKRRRLIAAVAPVHEGLVDRAGFWVGQELLEGVLRAAGE